MFKGLAVASIAPAVIAKACEDHAIPNGTVFSFGQRMMKPINWEEVGYQITQDTLTYIQRAVTEQNFYISPPQYIATGYSLTDVEAALKANNWDVIEAKHAARVKPRKKNWDLRGAAHVHK